MYVSVFRRSADVFTYIPKVAAGTLYNSTTGDLVDLLPILFTIVLVGGVAAYLVFAKKKE
jgi:hypothetical protein